MKKTSKILNLCLIIIICFSTNLLAEFFYSINCTTDELIKINFETGDIEVIGSLDYDIKRARLAYFQDRLFIMHNTLEVGLGILDGSNNVELIEISPYNGSKISVKTVNYNGGNIALSEGFNAFSNVIKIAFTVNVDAASELLGDIDLEGNITNVKEYNTADLDAIGINHTNNEIYSMDVVESELKTSIYKLNNDTTLSKIIDLNFADYKACDIEIIGSTLYFMNHYDNKLHSISLDDTTLKKSVNINIDSNNFINGLSITKEGDLCDIKDSDNDGVIDQWDECPSTDSDFVNKVGCSPQGLYTEDQMNQMVSSILSWGDTNGDNKINLIEAIKALRISSGVTEPNVK